MAATATAVAVAAAAAADKQRILHEELARPILLTDLVLKLSKEAESSRSECGEVAELAESICQKLRSAVRLTSSTPIYDRPIRRIAADVSKNLEKAVTLVRKCGHTGILRHVFFTITSSAADFKKVLFLLNSSIADLKWMRSIFDDDDDDDEGANLSIPPVVNNDPIFAWVWSSIASLQSNRKLSDRVSSANRLSSLASDNEHFRKVMVEEGAISPLLKLLKDERGSPEGQIAAAKAILHLANVIERTRIVAAESGFGVFVHVLGDSPIDVRVAVAELVAKVAEVDPTAREEFGHANVMKPLISCLVMDLDLENYKREGKTSSILAIAQNELASKNDHGYSKVKSKSSISSMEGSGSGHRRNRKNDRENASPEVKNKLKTKCALALWCLCKGSLRNSQKIAEPKGLFCLSKIIETEKGDLQKYCLMTIMEVAKVAESNEELRKVAWKPNSPPAKSVLDQLLRVVNEESSNPSIQIPAITAIGCLARIFSAKETRIIHALVGNLVSLNSQVSSEAAIALGKFACPANKIGFAHSKTIVEFNGVPLLMKMLNGSNVNDKVNGLVLLCYLSTQFGNSKALTEARAWRTLDNAMRSTAHNPELKDIILKAMNQLVLYQDGDHPHSHSHAIV